MINKFWIQIPILRIWSITRTNIAGLQHQLGHARKLTHYTRIRYIKKII